MNVVHKKTVEMLAIDDIVCNSCGESCLKGETPWVRSPRLGVVESRTSCYGLHAVVTGGYLSKHLEDCKRYEFAVCEKCLVEKVFPLFKIKPDVTGYAGGDLHDTWKERHPDEFELYHNEWVGLDGNANLVLHAPTREEFEAALGRLGDRFPEEGSIAIRRPDAHEASSKEQ